VSRFSRRMEWFPNPKSNESDTKFFPNNQKEKREPEGNWFRPHKWLSQIRKNVLFFLSKRKT
jgi:hypothetical protein